MTQVGADVVLTLSATDKITFANASPATVQAALHFGAAPGGGTGGGAGSTLTGTSGSDVLNGTAGNDDIHGLGGHDVIKGGGGNDHIFGGLGGDDLYGGAGADVFAYASLAEAPPYGLFYYESDRIMDWESIDRIDLSAVDANSTLGGTQAFVFAGYTYGAAPANPTAGSPYIGNSGEYHWVYGYTNNDATADLFIDVSSALDASSLTVDNLILG